MINFFNKTKHELPSEARKELAPRKEFLDRGRERFLAAFDASEFARNPAGMPVRTGGVTMFFKISIGVVAAFCVATSVSVYADTANVSVNNPLYPLKRASESVRLAIAPAAQKPKIQASLAVRRANEISALESSNPTSSLIAGLKDDLDADIKDSLTVTAGAANGHGHGRDNGNGRDNATSTSDVNGASSDTIDAGVGVGLGIGSGQGENENDNASSSLSSDNNDDEGSDAPLNVYCQAFLTNTSSVLFGRLENELSLHEGLWARFNARCAANDNARGTVNGTSNGQGNGDPLNINSTSTATGTIQILPQGDDGGSGGDNGSDNGGEGLKGHLDGGAYVRGLLDR